jgi:flagellar protein FlaG
MADETISTAILAVATIIAAIVLVNAIYPALYGAAGSILSMNDMAADRMMTDIKVLTEWYPGGSPADLGLVAWVKNTGSTTITGAEMNSTDVFLYTGGGTSVRVPSSGAGNNWSYSILGGDGDASWDPGETIQVTVHYVDGVSPGTLRFRMALHNGVYDEDAFAYT